MPTIDRRPRRRLKANITPAESVPDLVALARTATAGDWDNGLRRRLVRALTDAGLKPEHAIGVVRAYERRPALIPQCQPSVVAEGEQ